MVKLETRRTSVVALPAFVMNNCQANAKTSEEMTESNGHGIITGLPSGIISRGHAWKT